MSGEHATIPRDSFRDIFGGKRVWVSGHTGFKGSWLTQLLLELGAEVCGYALKPNTRPALFNQLKLQRRIGHEINDIRDARKVGESIRIFRPNFIFHLAAQPLVRRSYKMPLETYETNVMGTLHVLEAVRKYVNYGNPSGTLPVVVVTTDKVYENMENGRRYRETDRLGGRDPYSASKAMAEKLVASYRQSFFKAGPVRLVSARAGNVIGGGDWAEDRIVPDAMRALARGKPIPLRNPTSVRPWQHVLDPLNGYLTLAAALGNQGTTIREPRSDPQNSKTQKKQKIKSQIPNFVLSGAYNFGPNRDANRTVKELVDEILKIWPGQWKSWNNLGAPHEAGLLQLDNSLAWRELSWQPKWGFRKAIAETTGWYLDVCQRRSCPATTTLDQIKRYIK